MSNLEVSRLLAKCLVFPIAGMVFGKVLSILAISGYPWNVFGIVLIVIVGFGLQIQIVRWKRQAKDLMKQLEIEEND